MRSAKTPIRLRGAFPGRTGLIVAFCRALAHKDFYLFYFCVKTYLVELSVQSDPNGDYTSRKHAYIQYIYICNFDPLKPHFYIVKPGFTGVYIIFLISDQIHRLLVLVRTASARRF